MPYVTEEIWSWHFAESLGEESIHRASWPREEDFRGVSQPAKQQILDAATEILGSIHHAKSEAQKSLKWPVEVVTVCGPSEDLEAAAAATGDLERAGRINPGAMKLVEGGAEEGRKFKVEVVLSAEGP